MHIERLSSLSFGVTMSRPRLAVNERDDDVESTREEVLQQEPYVVLTPLDFAT